MGRELADGLDVDAAEAAGGRDGDLDGRIVGSRVTIRRGRCTSSGCGSGSRLGAMVPGPAMTGTKLPASLTFLKKSRPGWRRRAIRRWRARRRTRPGSPGSRSRVAGERDLALVFRLQQVGPVLRRIGRRRRGWSRRPSRRSSRRTSTRRRPWRLWGSCPRSRPCTAREVLRSWAGPNEKPTSMTSGACGPGLSWLALIASISSPELPSGLSSLIGMPYLAVKLSMPLAVVAPVPRQGDGREAALGLGRSDELFGRSACGCARLSGPGAWRGLRDAAGVEALGAAVPAGVVQAANRIADAATSADHRASARLLVSANPPQVRFGLREHRVAAGPPPAPRHPGLGPQMACRSIRAIAQPASPSVKTM